MKQKNELAWIWREKAKRDRKKQIKGLMRFRKNSLRPKKDKNIYVSKEEMDSREKFPLLYRRLRVTWPNVQVTEVLSKFGQFPKCYLTGYPIDYDRGETYELDHVVPRSKGGPSTIDNLQLANPVANFMKSDLALDKFIDMCRRVTRLHSLGKWSIRADLQGVKGDV